MATNNEKILKALENKKELITTTELANETSIDIKNISRYLKALENKGLIVRKTIQKGKLRLVKIGLVKGKPKPIVKRDLKPPKEFVLTEEEKAIVNLGKGNNFLKQVPKQVSKPTTQGIDDFDLDQLLFKWISDLDTRRSFVKLFKGILPEFKQVNTRQSKEQMTKDFNTTVKTRFQYKTPLINEMKQSNPLFMKQKSKHNQ